MARPHNTIEPKCVRKQVPQILTVLRTQILQMSPIAERYASE